MARQCGDCTLCCKLLPVRELQKLSNTRCQYQRYGKGCTVYNTRKMPGSCKLWNCRWIINDDTEELSRPDRVGYVIDIMPEYVVTIDNPGDAPRKKGVIQVWVDPSRPDAHRDPALRAYLERRARDEHFAALIRNGASEAFVLVAPCLNDEDKWLEIGSSIGGPEHTPEEIVTALGDDYVVVNKDVTIKVQTS